MKLHLNIVPVVLLLAGCGGADFGVNGSAVDGAGGSGGEIADGSTGGVTGVTGGSGPLGGSGGEQAGSGGEPGGTGGAGTGGQEAGTGGAAGGTGGAAVGGATSTGGAGGPGSGPIGTLGQPCSPDGSYACAGYATRGQLICSGGTWMSNGACSSGDNCDTSSGNAGFCNPIVAECVGLAFGDVVCRGTDRLQCGVDLVTTTPVDTCGYVCAAGSCTGVCTPGATQCAVGGVQTCSTSGQWEAPTACAIGASCQAGSCVCPGSQTVCNGACVDTSSDPNNCNTCGKICTVAPAHSAASCNAGQCAFTCLSGYQYNVGKTCCQLPGMCSTCCSP